MYFKQFYTGRRPLEEAVDISVKRWVRRAPVAGLVSLLIALGVAPCAVGQTPASETAEPRALQTLDAGWRFVQDDAMTDEVALAATGDGWTAVSLPHTWNANDAASTNATVPYKRGRGWYRLAFDAPARGARHWLQFDGAAGDVTPIRGLPAPADEQVYATYRAGRFRYDIPLPNGDYLVVLGFVEPKATTKAAERVFDVEANGTKVIAGLDVLREAGAYRTVLTRTLRVEVSAGRLALSFTPTTGEALVSTITITKE